MALANTNLAQLDFSKLYIEQMEKSTFKSKNSDDWDKKAKNMSTNIFKSSYSQEFIKKMDLTNCSTLLDVGCGPGTIALNLSNQMEKIYALDYSLEMLSCVETSCKENKIANIKTIHKSWYDNWDDIPNADIVVASRSMEVADIKDAILKLNSKANKKVYLSTKVGGSFIDKEILNQLQRDIYPRPDYIYLLNILHSMGIYAKVDFIKNENSKYDCSSAEEFVERISWSLGELTEEEKLVLTNYFNNVYKNKECSDFIYWAFISWNK